jgi:hypothetical protein
MENWNISIFDVFLPCIENTGLINFESPTSDMTK